MSLGDLGNLDLGQLHQYLPDLNFLAGKRPLRRVEKQLAFRSVPTLSAMRLFW